MLPTHPPIKMEQQRDVRLVQLSNDLCMVLPLRWAGIRVWSFLTYKHSSPTVHRQEHRRILCTIPPTIARLVTRITMVEINRLRSGWRLPNHKTSVQ